MASEEYKAQVLLATFMVIFGVQPLVTVMCVKILLFVFHRIKENQILSSGTTRVSKQ